MRPYRCVGEWQRVVSDFTLNFAQLFQHLQWWCASGSEHTAPRGTHALAPPQGPSGVPETRVTWGARRCQSSAFIPGKRARVLSLTHIRCLVVYLHACFVPGVYSSKFWRGRCRESVRRHDCQVLEPHCKHFHRTYGIIRMYIHTHACGRSLCFASFVRTAPSFSSTPPSCAPNGSLVAGVSRDWHAMCWSAITFIRQVLSCYLVALLCCIRAWSSSTSILKSCLQL